MEYGGQMQRKASHTGQYGQYQDLLPSVDNETTLKLLEELNQVVRGSVARSLEYLCPDEFVVSFSGGIDSAILASLLANESKPITIFSVGKVGSHDIRYLTKNRLPLPNAHFVLEQVDDETIRKTARETIPKVKIEKLSHLEDCVAFSIIGDLVRKRIPNAKCIVTANGPDELFCGYDRFRRIYREAGGKEVEMKVPTAIRAAFNLKEQVNLLLAPLQLCTSEPFLSKEILAFAKTVPLEAKILGPDDMLRKRLWRAYGRSIGLDEATVSKSKKAMQYSMGLHSPILRVVRELEIAAGA